MITAVQQEGVLQFRTGAVPPGTLAVRALDGREAISRPYAFELNLGSSDPAIDTRALLEQPAAIHLKQSVRLRGCDERGITTLKIHGVILSFELREKTHDWTVYRAALVPRLQLLSLNVRSRVFLNRSVPDIVRDVLRDNGLSDDDFVLRCDGRAYRAREYVVQYGESDLDFISRLLEHEGIFYFFRQEDDRDVVVFADGPSIHEPIAGSATVPFDAADGANGRGAAEAWFGRESVHRVVLRHARLPSAVTLQDYNYRTPSLDLRTTAPTGVAGQGTVYEFGEHYADETEGRELARVRAEEIRCRERRFLGESDVKSMRAGARFTLSEHFRESCNVAYVLTEVRHVAEQSALQSPGGLVALYRNEFAAIPADVPFRPPRVTPKPRVSSLNARVDAAGDGKYAEIDDQGRYKVKLPLDLSDRDRGRASHWVRMAQPYGGADHGAHFPLHKGTEVVLAHVNGDPDRPIIAAAVPNPERASLVTGANQTQCIVKSSGNNLLRFEDLEGSEHVFLHAQRDLDIRVKGERKETVEGRRHLVVQKDKLEHVQGARHEKVDGDHKEEIGGARNLSVAGQEVVDVGGKRSLTVTGDVVEVFKASATTEVTGAAYLKAGNVVIEAEGGITLKVGGSCVVIDGNGVTLKGTQVVLDGSMTKINSGSGSSPLSGVPGKAAAPAPPDAPAEPGQSSNEPPPDGAGRGDSWISFDLKDEEGRPVPHEMYRLRLPDGSVRTGYLDRDGAARVEGIPQGECRICFPRIDPDEWRPA